MNKSLSPNRLMLKLAGRGIPPTYAHRVARELEDHASDLADDAETQLGEPDRLVEEIVASYRNRTFAGRHPLATFLLLPLPLTIVSFLVFFGGIVLGVSCLFEAYAWLTGTPFNLNNYYFASRLTLYVSLMVLPTMFSTWLVCRWARSAGLKWSHTFWACSPIFLWAMIFLSYFSFFRVIRQTLVRVLILAPAPLCRISQPVFVSLAARCPDAYSALGDAGNDRS